MHRSHFRARSLLTLGAAGLGLSLLAGCNPKEELLAPQQPGVILPSDVQSAAGAEGFYNGAVGNFGRGLLGGNGNQETIWQFTGLLTDEFRSSDTFSQRNDADQRITQTNDGVLSPLYNTLQQVRGSARTAIGYLKQFEPTTSSLHQAEMYYVIAFAEMQLGEDFCNGIPLGETVNGVANYTKPLATKDVFTVALARVDSGITLVGTDKTTAGQQVLNALLITRGRLQVDLGDYAGAAASVAPVPVSFQYDAEYAQSTADNGWWIMTTSSHRYSVGDSVDATGTIANALPYVSAKDPRVPASLPTTKNKNGFDGITPLFLQGIWGRDDPVAIADGLDGQLIQAEAQLNANNFVGMTTILNNLRASPPTQGIFKPASMSPLAPPATFAAARALFFREKAFWTFGRGQRLGDLRRLVRQYGLTQDQVYPTGAFFKNGSYGTRMFFPVPDTERSNPNFTGCLDQNA
jgi:hypothetical protein